MDPKPAPSSSKPPDSFPNGRWPGFLRSWAWRYYDHLGHLVLYNLGWVLTACLLGWYPVHRGWLGNFDKLNPLGLGLTYLGLSAISIGWAYLVFRLFNLEQASLGDAWAGYKKYFWKGMGIALLTGMALFLSFESLRFYWTWQSPNQILKAVAEVFSVWMLLIFLSCALYQWPVLFFQDPPLGRVFHRSLVLALGNGLFSMAILGFFALFILFFSFAPFLWFFLGPVFFFSMQAVWLEKCFLRYKITYGDKPLEPFLEYLTHEKQRGWRDLLKPWENR